MHCIANLIRVALLCPLLVSARSDFDKGQAVDKLSDAYGRRVYEARYGGSKHDSPACATEHDIAAEHKVLDADEIHEIYLVPHTHDDVGWQLTVASYYNASVHHILNSVVADLAENPNHRFIWSEIKWIEMWWPRQNDTTRAKFRRLVRNGQLEFVGGGWSQADEVTPSYRDITTNVVTGHEYLREILGDWSTACPRGRCVRFGWQIDMFAGYSATTPTLWRAAGFDGMVVRFEGTDALRNDWENKKELEFLWEGSSVLSEERTRIATHAIRWNYGDALLSGRNGSAYGYRGPDLTFDFGTRKLHNHADVQRYAHALVSWSKLRGAVYRGNRHLLPWGSDFQFTNAGLWFAQMDQLVAEINGNVAKYGAHVRYSTLSTYFDKLHASAEPLPIKRGSFFEVGWPHSWVTVGTPLIGLTANFSAQYQTGALSSRPAHKQRVRTAAAQLRAAQTLHAIAHSSNRINTRDVNMPSFNDLFCTAWDTHGVMQHHDSMPGTMKTAESVSCPDNVPAINGLDYCNRTADPNERVLEDYTARLTEARQATNRILASSLEALEGLPRGSLSLALPRTDTESNHTGDGCQVKEDKIVGNCGATVILFNQEPYARTEMVCVDFEPLVRGGSQRTLTIPSVYRVNENTGIDVPVIAQLKVNDELNSQLTMSHVPAPPFANAVFFLAQIAPFGTSKYEVRFESDLRNSTTTVIPQIIVGAAAIERVGGLHFAKDPLARRVRFDSATGLMREYEMKAQVTDGGEAIPKVTRAAIRQGFWQYVDAVGGAYCLIEQQHATRLSPPFRVAMTRGPVLQEVVQSFAFGSGLMQRVRLVAHGTHGTGRNAAAAGIELVHAAGRLPSGRELISRLETDIASGSIVHTDASGFGELFARPLNRTASIAQNYHAFVQSAVLRDEGGGRQLSVLTRRTMGVAALHTGELEYMLMRRIASQSDNQGPWPLDDKDSMTDVIRLMLEPTAIAELNRASNVLALEHPLVMFYLRPCSRQSHHRRAADYGYARTAGAMGVALRRSKVTTHAHGFPAFVYAELFVRRDGAPLHSKYVVRLQNMAPTGNVVAVPSLATALGMPLHRCIETTLTMQQTRRENDRLRLQWNARTGPTQTFANKLRRSTFADKDGVTSASAACDTEIKLAPLDIRTWTFSLP